ncbi:MAG: glycosyltransferase family 2 protein [Patescibacteria group bacterium]
MPQKKFDLSLVIVNYNAQYWLKKLLDSLKKNYLKQTKKSVQIIVVDNASTDESVKLVKKHFPWVELIVLEKNIGFSAGNNVALRSLNCRFAMLINSDIEFLPQSNLDDLYQFMEKNPQVGIATPKLTLTSGKIDPACHRGEPTPWASLTYFLKLEKLFPNSKRFAQYHQLYKNLNTIHEIDACSGAGMMLRWSAVKKIGLLDERFFMYGEDLDWCKRFRDSGFKIIFYPKITLIHHKYKSGIKSSSDRTSTTIKIQFYNAMLKYFDKHYAASSPRIYRWILRLFLFVKKGGL